MNRRHFIGVAAGVAFIAARPLGRTSQEGGEYEFDYENAAARAAVTAFRRSLGPSPPPPFRLEGQLEWRGPSAGAAERWGITMQWPSRYQQRSGERTHTIVDGRYTTNGAASSALREVAHQNVQANFELLAILLLGRPAASGYKVVLRGSERDNKGVRRDLDVSGPSGAQLQLIIADDGKRRVIRPWTLSSGVVDRHEVVRESVRVKGILLPSKIDWLVGSHRGEIRLTAEVGATVTRDFVAV
jgi:hypothetical protein